MKYLQRDENGIVVGVYGERQYGIAEEEVDDSNEHVVEHEKKYRELMESINNPNYYSFVSALDLWTRLTDEEAMTVKQAMTNQPFRIQKIFETAQTFREDHELWPLLQGMAVSLFGSERAGEILAPSN